jgi:dihydrofolate reductase
MRKIRYAVASSLDGYIAGPNGEIDWIVNDPAVDFAAKIAQFDALLVGRLTFETMMKAGRPTMAGMQTLVFSRTLAARDLPKGVSLVDRDHLKFLESLRSKPGKDIWLFGGGSLFASLLSDGLVDAVEVSVMPTLLGGGVPLFPTESAASTKLRLEAHKVYLSGIVSLSYSVKGTARRSGNGSI